MSEPKTRIEEERDHRPDHALGAPDGAGGRLREVVVERDRSRRHHLERLRAHQRTQRLVGAALALAETERGELRRPALELHGDHHPLSVARDLRHVDGREGIVGRLHPGHPRVPAQRRQRPLHLGAEGGIPAAQGGVAEDQVEGRRLLRELALDEAARRGPPPWSGGWDCYRTRRLEDMSHAAGRGSAGRAAGRERRFRKTKRPQASNTYASAAGTGASVLEGA